MAGWADPNGKGWYSGDNHIHAKLRLRRVPQFPARWADMIAGEAATSATSWSPLDSDIVYDRTYFRGPPDSALHLPQRPLLERGDAQHHLGHLTLVNLKQVVEPVFPASRTRPTVRHPVDERDLRSTPRRQGRLVNYTHPASRIDDIYRGAYVVQGAADLRSARQDRHDDVMAARPRQHGPVPSPLELRNPHDGVGRH